MFGKLSEMRKALASALGAALTALTFTHNLPFLPSSITTTIGVVLAVLTPIVTFLAPNKS